MQVNDPAVDPLAGTPYRVLRRLGRGASGSVLLAAAADGTLVAVKVLDSDDPEARTRFLIEQQVDVAHPNVVRNLDWRQDRARSLLVMDFANAGDLQTWLDTHDEAAPEVVLDIAAQLLAGLTHLHDRGVIHRDLKPSNTLFELLSGAPRPTVRISDFGLAIAPDGPRVTQLPMPAGTAGFIAPELFGGADADQRSDLFSLGMVLTPLVDRCPDPPPEILSLVHALTRPAPSDRPRSARAAARMLDDLPPVERWPAEQLPVVLEVGEVAAAEGPPLGQADLIDAGAPVAVADAVPAAPAERGPASGTRTEWSERVLTAVAVAALVLALMAVAAGGPEPAVQPVPVGTAVNGQDLASGSPVQVDLGMPVTAEGSGARPEAVRLQLHLGPVGLGSSSEVRAEDRAGGGWSAALPAGSTRVWASGPVGAELVLRRSGGTGDEVVPFLLDPVRPWWTSLAGWLLAAATLGLVALVVAELRPLLRGRRLLRSGAALVVACAGAGAVATMWAWAAGGSVLSSGTLAHGALVGALLGVSAGCAAARLGRSRRRRRRRVVTLVEPAR